METEQNPSGDSLNLVLPDAIALNCGIILNKIDSIECLKICMYFFPDFLLFFMFILLSKSLKKTIWYKYLLFLHFNWFIQKMYSNLGSLFIGILLSQVGRNDSSSIIY